MQSEKHFVANIFIKLQTWVIPGHGRAKCWIFLSGLLVRQAITNELNREFSTKNPMPNSFPVI